VLKKHFRQWGFVRRTRTGGAWRSSICTKAPNTQTVQAAAPLPAERSSTWRPLDHTRQCCLQKIPDTVTHQMAVQDLVGHWAQSIHHQGADGDVGHKAAIHHVNVHPPGAEQEQQQKKKRKKCQGVETVCLGHL
jgi:hypothetical protein